VVVAAGGFVAWLFGTESGLQWIVRQATTRMDGRLVVEGTRGTLASVVEIERLRFDAEGTIVEARGIAGHGHLATVLAGRLVIEPLRITSLDITLGPDTGKPSSTPALPFGIRVGQLDLARLRLQLPDAAYTLRDVRFTHLALSVPSGISAEGSFELEHEQVPIAASITLAGTLDALNAHLKGTARGIPADVRALITPRKPQKIASLDARAGPVDLASIDAELPHTALDLIVKATGTANGFTGSLDAANKAAGPLDRQRLPVGSAHARFATDLESLTLQDLRLALAGGGVLEGRAG
jgi:hypothetical protein